MRTIVHTDEYALSAGELSNLRAALAEPSAGELSPIEPEFYEKYGDCHNLLPDGLRRFLADFRDNDVSTACVVSGFPIDDASVGPTPHHWERPEGHNSTLEPDI